ncbi:fatty acyl-CoA reductase wat-like [Pseudomyrmex gracilis]|uniref:fatty acyl-CoA reductase wat-like n=1 Tax=Pseudomyrmex gracilis TaxID=219809 RepID=UPI0009956631|nr:fatty acyl-CoA reductase wat-like [Pseudomyrmex gracilis]
MVEVLLDRIDGDVIPNQEVTVAEDNCIPECTTKENNLSVTENLTPIQEFYHGQSVFLTGGTGFMGKLLIEKLLRMCPGIGSIYLLMRAKKGKDVHQRTEEIFDDVLFEKLKKKHPKFRHQIVAVAGDCSQPYLGMSPQDRATIIREVTIVFHVAATVRFDEKLKLAVPINVRSTKDVFDLCREIPNLKSFVHVSTAYANCPQSVIEEKFYDPPMDYDKLIALMECVDDKLAEDITSNLLGKWPNTYAYTKAVAENVIRKEAGDMPVGIFRPAIVISTYREPIKGWIDNLYGPTGVAAGAGTGLLRSIHCDGSTQANVVPADLTVNALIACAWDVANFRRLNNNATCDEVPIYNYVSKDNPITYDELKDKSSAHGLRIPPLKAVWYYSFRNTKHKVVHLFFVYFFHLLPALLIDTATVCVGRQPRLLKVYKKVHKFMNVLSYFSTQEWKFTNERMNAIIDKMTPQDREKFNCDIKSVDWDPYFEGYIRGIRVFLIKDPLDTLPQARAKWQKLYWCHQVVKLILAYGFLRFSWMVLLLFFNDFNFMREMMGFL